MRVLAPALALAGALALAAGRADGQPTAVPTAAGAGAVAPSDQTAVKPALPDTKANATLPLGTAPPTPAPLPPAGEAGRPAPTATPAAAVTAAPPGDDEPGRSEPNTGASPAGAGGGHRKPSVSGGRRVTVASQPPLTVVAYEPGKSLTLRRPEGTTVTYGISKKAQVPKGLAPGRSVTVRTRTEHGRKVVTRVRESGETPVLTNVN